MKPMNIGKLNSGLPGILKSIEEYSTRKSFTLDNNASYINNPYISPEMCRYFKLNNPYLNLCANTLADDAIMNTISVTDNNNEPVNEYNSLFNNKFKYQLRNAALDYYVYGYALVEILDNNNIVQIPANTVKYLKDGNGNYLANQQVNGKNVKFKILGLKYTDEYDDLSTVGIIGASEESNFYTQPKYLGLVSALAENILIEKSSVLNLENGNNLSGILAIRGDLPYTDEETEVPIEEQLKKEIASSGDGIMSLILREDSTSPINIDFIKINKDNEDKLQNKYDSNTKALLSMFNIPDVRLGINSGTESINSQKSKTEFNIYSITLQKEQLLFEFFLEDLLDQLYGKQLNVNIETPVFEDITEMKIGNIIKLFTNGLVTLREAINNLRDVPGIKLSEELVDDDILLDSRFSSMSSLLTEFGKTTEGDTEQEILKSLEKDLEQINILAKKE